MISNDPKTTSQPPAPKAIPPTSNCRSQTLAMHSHLLGAEMLGLENVMVIGGDPFNERDLAGLQEMGIKRIYLIAPVLKGGARDYEAAQAVLEATLQ